MGELVGEIMRRDEEILNITQEECAELIQVISKIRRFGPDGEYSGKTNSRRLTDEVGDILCMVDLLMQYKLVDKEEVNQARLKKYEKLKIWSNIFKEEE